MTDKIDVLDKCIDTNTQNFGEHFNIDGVPLWWFLSPFIKQLFLPSPFRNLMTINIDSTKSESIVSRINKRIFSFGMRRGLLIKETMKWAKFKQKISKGDPRDVLFLCYTNRTVTNCNELESGENVKIIRNLSKNKVNPLVLFCDPIVKAVSSELSMRKDTVYSYVDSRIILESKILSNIINRKWSEISDDEKNRIFSLGGVCYWNIFKNELNFLFSKEFLRVLIVYYFAFKKIIEMNEIKVVYITSLGGFYETPLLVAAYKLNKNVVHSPHGYGDRFFIIDKTLLKNVFFACWGDVHKKRMLKLGINNNHISVTGSPFFDDVTDYRKKEQDVDICLLTVPLVEDGCVDKKLYFAEISELIGKLSSISKNILIKTHPREKYVKIYQNVMKSNGLNSHVVSSRGKDVLYECIGRSKLILSFGSTSDIEAMMLNKPVILMKFLKPKEMIDIEDNDICRKYMVTADCIDETIKLSKNVISGKIVKKFLIKQNVYIRKEFYKLDGKSYERVAEFIKRMLHMQIRTV